MLPIPCFSVSTGPNSSQRMDILSMVMVMMTMGKRATESPRSIPSLWVNTLSTAINKTTMMSTDAKRGTTSSFRCSRYKRMLRPRAIMILKRTRPHRSSVSRNASAMRTGIKVPKVFSPTTFRSITSRKAPTGTRSRTWYTACVLIGRLNREKSSRKGFLTLLRSIADRTASSKLRSIDRVA